MHRAHKNYYLLIIYIYIYSNFLPFVVIDDFSHGDFSLFYDIYIYSHKFAVFLNFFLS
jgi:hypothetical protein